MNIKFHFKTGKEFVITNIDGEFRSFCIQLYKQDVQMFEDVCVRVSEIEFI